jgi:hypothetical protein
MKRTFCAFLFMLIVPVGLSAEDVASWRVLVPKELGPDSSWREEHPGQYLMVTADFDGDGKNDVACLLINDKENKMGLFVTLSSRMEIGPFLLEAIDDKNTIEVMGIAIAKPGTYKTACGKGYWACEKGEPAQLRLRRPAIDFFRFGSANSYFMWCKDKKKFDRIWMSD